MPQSSCQKTAGFLSFIILFTFNREENQRKVQTKCKLVFFTGLVSWVEMKEPLMLNGVEELDWSVQNPDLNLIQHLWDELELSLWAGPDRPTSVFGAQVANQTVNNVRRMEKEVSVSVCWLDYDLPPNCMWLSESGNVCKGETRWVHIEHVYIHISWRQRSRDPFENGNDSFSSLKFSVRLEHYLASFSTS